MQSATIRVERRATSKFRWQNAIAETATKRYYGRMTIGAFFSNPWVVGIGGGVLSGFLVALLTRYTFSQKDDKEYAQKLLSANLEVVYALRSLISEPVFPTKEIVNSLINANARKYNVEPGDMYNLEQLVDELIKEVMDSSFIPNKTKLEYSNQLTQLKQPLRIDTGGPGRMQFITQVQSESVRKEYRKKMLNALSLTLGLMVTLSTVALTFLNSSLFSSALFSPEKGGLAVVFLPLVMGVLAALLAPLSIMVKSLESKSKDIRKKLEDEKEQTEEGD